MCLYVKVYINTGFTCSLEYKFIIKLTAKKEKK